MQSATLTRQSAGTKDDSVTRSFSLLILSYGFRSVPEVPNSHCLLKFSAYHFELYTWCGQYMVSCPRHLSDAFMIVDAWCILLQLHYVREQRGASLWSETYKRNKQRVIKCIAILSSSYERFLMSVMKINDAYNIIDFFFFDNAQYGKLYGNFRSWGLSVTTVFVKRKQKFHSDNFSKIFAYYNMSWCNYVIQ